MPAAPWRIDLDSEARVLIPWMDSGPDPRTYAVVRRWLETLARNPLGRGVEERPGLFAALVPGTDVAVVWSLRYEEREVVLLLLG
ncbi:MAG: hypothetical protein LC722_01145 [Actinobacteria bacterium]|nr:hypothetical protein [Actinomycetota bacterium]